MPTSTPLKPHGSFEALRCLVRYENIVIAETPLFTTSNISISKMGPIRYIKINLDAQNRHSLIVINITRSSRDRANRFFFTFSFFIVKQTHTLSHGSELFYHCRIWTISIDTNDASKILVRMEEENDLAFGSTGRIIDLGTRMKYCFTKINSLLLSDQIPTQIQWSYTFCKVSSGLLRLFWPMAMEKRDKLNRKWREPPVVACM